MEGELGVVMIRVGRFKDEIDGDLAGGTGGRVFDDAESASSGEEGVKGVRIVENAEFVLEADKPRVRPGRLGGGGGGAFEIEDERATVGEPSSFGRVSETDIHCSGLLT